MTATPGTDGMALYWGDLHSHCAVSYGHGTPARAFACARQQLDFCSITGHAFWPDMPTDRDRYAHVIDYHREGFARLRENWPALVEVARAHEEPGRFVPFLSYEWHSLAYGDHNVYYRDADGPLVDAPDLDSLEVALGEQRRPFMIVPHHIGYRRGYRGIDWSEFSGDRSPLVEIMSLHGSSESDLAPYPQLHTMGPRDAGSTAEHGLRRGHVFGFVGSTDHHGGFPGSYGDGRVGVWARSLDRDGLWDALTSRRTTAVTGDKIAALLRVDGAWPGSVVEGAGPRRLEVEVRASDAIDYVEVLKNERLLHRIDGSPLPRASDVDSGPLEAKIRIEWGWGRRGTRREVHGEVRLEGGELLHVEPCFRGETILSPDDPLSDPDRVPHEIERQDAGGCAWRSLLTANPSPQQSATQAVILTVRAATTDAIVLHIDGVRMRASLGELLEGSRGEPLHGWLSEAVRIHRAVPEACYTLRWSQRDADVRGGRDMYRVRVRQRNDQWAWTSPIWVDA